MYFIISHLSLNLWLFSQSFIQYIFIFLSSFLFFLFPEEGSQDLALTKQALRLLSRSPRPSGMFSAARPLLSPSRVRCPWTNFHIFATAARRRQSLFIFPQFFPAFHVACCLGICFKFTDSFLCHLHSTTELIQWIWSAQHHRLTFKTSI